MSENVINKADWNRSFETKGAIFLPMGGSRKSIINKLFYNRFSSENLL